MHKKFLAILFLFSYGALAAFGQSQQQLSNSDVPKLAKAGLSEDFVLHLIEQNGSNLSGDVSSLIDLKNNGVSERVIAAISKKRPSQEALNSDSVIRLVRAGFSENFVLDLMARQPGKYSVGANRIVELKQAGVSERILSQMVGQTAERTLPSNSEISIRLIDSIDSQRDNPGKEFRASLEDAIEIGGEKVVPKGADATVRLAEEKESGKLSGKTELKLELVSVRVDGRTVPVMTSSVTEYSKSRTGRTVKSAAAVGAVGAIIGAIAGGGKGAAIGAGAGAATGAGAQVFMKGQRVQVPSETVLTFTTTEAVKLQ